METFFDNISQVLGITIIHSLWQGLLIYAVIRLLLIGFPALSANVKYNLLYAALSVMAFWFAYTFFIETKNYSWATHAPASFNLSDDTTAYDHIAHTPSGQPIEQPFHHNYKPIVQTCLPYIAVLYVISLMLNLVRFALGWQKIRKIKRCATPAHDWQPLTDKLTQQAGILKNVQINFSKLVDVPCAIGYLKPVVLLPITISTQLSAEEIEVIILHELAHLKNNDYILNLIQQIMALLLFLNPFAQLLSRMIDLERENRCDDTVLQIGDPLTYAGALVKLERNRQQNLQLALAATGNGYHLLDRVKRIMSEDRPVVNIKHLVFGLLIFIGSLGSIAWLNPEIRNGKLVSKRASKAMNQLTDMIKGTVTKKDDKLPAKERMVITKIADSSKIITPKIDIDTVLPTSETEALRNEFRRIMAYYQKDREESEKSTESKQVYDAQQKFDSLYQANFKTLYTPEIEKESKEKSQALNDYITRVAPERRALLKKISDLIYMHPAMVAFESELKRKEDSLVFAVMQTKGLNKMDASKTPDLQNWYQFRNTELNLLRAKLLTPQLKASQDSLSLLASNLFQTPEYLALRKAMSNNPELGKIQQLAKVGLEPYENAIKQASAKFNENSKTKKYREDTKKLKEVFDKLKGQL